MLHHRISVYLFCLCLLFQWPALTRARDGNGIALTRGRYVPPAHISMEVAVKGNDDLRVLLPETASKSLPVISEGLNRQIDDVYLYEPVRVIVYVNDLPGRRIREIVEARYALQRQAVKTRARAINHKYTDRRNLKATHDAANYRPEILRMSDADWAELRRIGRDNEQLAFDMQTEILSGLRRRVALSQAPVITHIQSLGGRVEYSAMAGNAIIATLPAAVVTELAKNAHVARIVEDRLLNADLNIAAAATRVSDPNGLWDNGFGGGTYDPAVIDTGTDRSHPALQDVAGRTNFWSWQLNTAVTSSDYDTNELLEDDLQGHGTHVMGIVASYGSTGWMNHLGMAFGVEKAVTLKAGWRNNSGGGSMYWSDCMRAVDQALNDTSNLNPVGTFGSDEVDGFNLSFGGDVNSDDSSIARFWDSVIDSYPDIVVTISAGNDGPSNVSFNEPANSYNVITVANVDDHGTTTRADDTIRSSSTRGPTAGGRRKPDIAAPGTNIASTNNGWETGSDFVNKTGTSMAAPMVLGVAMDLMDAGVTDELEIKALLINTAQKNEPGINFEGDADGWSTAFGWGYLNALAAYAHRDDVDSYIVAEAGQPGDFLLFKGQMQDEGSTGEGRDRATMVWNRPATYKAATSPTTWAALSDLNLELYREADDFQVDSDETAMDNVQQVRIDAGAGLTDVVVKPYAATASFPHGQPEETFALALEEGFTPVQMPQVGTDLPAFSLHPAQMEPGEQQTFQIWIHNDGDVAVHNNTFNLSLPAGWVLISGADTQNVGSTAAGADSAHAVWTLQAQGAAQDAVTVTVQHSHNSYGENVGSYNWELSVDVKVDPHCEQLGDLNGDNEINAADLDEFLQYWLQPECSAITPCNGADINLDDRVDLIDYAIINSHWLEPCL